jgi:hypothetical protein
VTDARKLTICPLHIGLDPDAIAMETVGVTEFVTLIVIAFEVIVAGLAHIALLIMVHVTISLFAKDALVNIVPPEPTFDPLICH